jgi:hypothetical protein
MVLRQQRKRKAYHDYQSSIYQKLANGVSDFIYYPFNFVSSLSFLQHQVIFCVFQATEFVFFLFIFGIIIIIIIIIIVD